MRSTLTLLLLLLFSGCATALMPPGPATTTPRQVEDAFIMADGTRLPYRAWLPEGRDPRTEPPWAVILALHGMNDSRDAWNIPAPAFTDAGIALYAPDQRGFGDTPQRGHWPGGEALARDAAAMAHLLRARHPGARLILIGESMGAAIAMLAATGPNPPPVDGYVLLAPAVWGRAQMNVLMRAGLWLGASLLPGLTVSSSAAVRTASDNRDALIQLSRNPRTIKQTRLDTIRGLVDLMDAAQAAAPRLTAPALTLYGGKDEIIPPHAARAAWARLPDSTRRAYYPAGYHLLLRDKGRALPIADILAWMRRPAEPLAAEPLARGFLASPD